jgi:hypothetical protein
MGDEDEAGKILGSRWWRASQASICSRPPDVVARLNLNDNYLSDALAAQGNHR